MKNDYDRGTYEHVRDELIRAAQYRGLTTYLDIAVVMGLDVNDPRKMQSDVGPILRQISADEHAADRPMLTAVAIGAKGRPSDPFFEQAKDFGRYRPSQTKKWFWERELRIVYKHWKRTYRQDSARG